MRTLLSGASRRAAAQVFVLAGPLAGRIAASLPQSAVLEGRADGRAATILIGQGAGRAHLPGPFGVGALDDVSEFHSPRRRQWQELEHHSSNAWHQRLARSALDDDGGGLARGLAAAAGGRLMAAATNASDSAANQRQFQPSQDLHHQPQDLALLQNQNHQIAAAGGAGLASALARLSGWELLLVALLISLILISIVGNCLVCIAIFTDRRLRKLGNAFIVSLAIADLFVSCLVMTFALCNDLMDYWMFGAWFCDLWISFDIMCCTASILNLCAISLDRFIHIKDCLLYNQLMTRRVAISAVIGIWIISALVSFVPINLGWHKPNHFKSPPLPAGGLIPRHLAALNQPEAPPWQLISARDNGRAQAGAHERAKRWAAGESEEWQLVGLALASTNARHRPSSFVNKDFVPANKRRRRRGASDGNEARPRGASSGRDDGRRVRSPAPAPPPQVNPLEAAAEEERANCNSDKLADGGGRVDGAHGRRAPGDQVESNPQDGRAPRPRPPPAGKRQIKPQQGGRAARQAAELEEETKSSAGGGRVGNAAQTSFGAHASATLLDHADGELAQAGRESPMPPPPPPAGRPHSSSASQNDDDGDDGAGANAADDEAGHLPQCMLTLTPTYAIISSTISFYIPCLIMLGLYSKLFACARRHVRNIRAITRAPPPIGGEQSNNLAAGAGGGLRRASSSNSAARPAGLSRARTWLKFGATRRPRPAAAAAEAAAAVAPEASALAGAPLDAARAVAAPAPLCQVAPNDCGGGRSSSSSSSNKHEQDERQADGKSASISAMGGANEQTIGPPEAREDAPFLARGAGAKAAAGNNNCDNANDPQNASSAAAAGGQKFVTNFSATTIKLSLAPGARRQAANSGAHGGANTAAASSANLHLQHKQQTSQLATHKAAVTLGIIMGTFLFCWVPFFCLNILKAFYADRIPGSMFRAFTWLGYANSALNPIIYGIHNSEFRNAFNRIFFKHLTLKNGRQYLNRRFSHDLRPHHHAHHHAQHSNRRHHQAHGGGGGGGGNAFDQNSGGGNAQNCANHQQQQRQQQAGKLEGQANNCQRQQRLPSGQRLSLRAAGETRPLVDQPRPQPPAGRVEQQQGSTPQQSFTTIHRTSEET